MPDTGNETWDDDIARMKLSDVEKNGLQVYRNYTAAFDKQKIDIFCNEIDAVNHDLSELSRVCQLLRVEDPRTAPLILCAYVDDLLKKALKASIPDGVPGGKAELFKSFGPMASFDSRLKIAYAFGLCGTDILTSINIVRDVRNVIAHNWRFDELERVWALKRMGDLPSMVRILGEQTTADFSDLSEQSQLRIQCIWLAGRFSYEAPLWWRAKGKQLSPFQALYGSDRQPKVLRSIAEICFVATHEIASDAQ